MGTVILYMSSLNECCTLLITCVPKAFHDGSAKFTTEVFECMVRLKKFSLRERNRERETERDREI